MLKILTQKINNIKSASACILQ